MVSEDVNVQVKEDSQEIAQLKALIRKERATQNEVFVQLGRAYYQVSKENNTVAEEPFASLTADIDTSNDKIMQYQAEIERIENINKCPTCGQKYNDDSIFCTNCGTRLQEVANESPSHCTQCGVELTPDDIFCFNCGTKIIK